MHCIVHGVTKNWTQLSDFHTKGIYICFSCIVALFHAIWQILNYSTFICCSKPLAKEKKSEIELLSLCEIG